MGPSGEAVTSTVARALRPRALHSARARRGLGPSTAWKLLSPGPEENPSTQHLVFPNVLKMAVSYTPNVRHSGIGNSVGPCVAAESRVQRNVGAYVIQWCLLAHEGSILLIDFLSLIVNTPSP